VTDYSQYSFWLETAGEDLTPRPQLQRSAEVDVAVLGAGFSGLWTAYYLLREDPGLKIAIVEKEIAGFGASGRNGGWCTPRFPVTPARLEERYGREAARALLLAMFDTFGEVGRVCEEERIDAQFRKTGYLSLARGLHQLPAIRSTLDQYERLGLNGRYRWMSAEEASERVRVTKLNGALYGAESAAIHPGRLVRGLARAVEQRGAAIYEQTEVIDFEPGAAPKLVTKGGQLRAKRAVVLAGEAYLTRLAKLHRSLLPVYSLIVLTEPLTRQQWAQVGWQNGESIASNKYTVNYLTKTADGRILFGSRGAPYQFGSRIKDSQDRHEPTHALARRSLLEWFPMLAGIGFTHAWGGPLGMPRDWMPSVTFDPGSRIAMACGYVGQGVATTNLSGRILASLILEKSSALTALPLTQRRLPQWEPEPLRWLGVRYAQNALARIDEAAEAGRPRPLDAGLAEFFNRH
jgi:glycine/D-amino acid oxidase-like deaminating enzyme